MWPLSVRPQKVSDHRSMIFPSQESFLLSVSLCTGFVHPQKTFEEKEESGISEGLNLIMRLSEIAGVQ